MRAAKPQELKTHAYPVLSAAISPAELAKWFPIPFHHITDPQEAAEPSRAAVVKLDAGDFFVLAYGEISNQMMLRIPTSSDPSQFLQSFFREVPLPRGRIVWRREDARLPRTVATKTVTTASLGRQRKKASATKSSRAARPSRK